MFKKILKSSFLLALAAVIGVSALTLVAGPDTEREFSQTTLLPYTQAKGGGMFQACPWPPCMAPCTYPPAPEVLCKPKNGPAYVTSFFCCCCGGSDGTRYRRL